MLNLIFLILNDQGSQEQRQQEADKAMRQLPTPVLCTCPVCVCGIRERTRHPSSCEVSSDHRSRLQIIFSFLLFWVPWLCKLVAKLSKWETGYCNLSWWMQPKSYLCNGRHRDQHKQEQPMSYNIPKSLRLISLHIIL